MRTTRQMPADSPPAVEYRKYHCPKCFCMREHARYVRGRLEKLVCRMCGNELTFTLSKLNKVSQNNVESAADTGHTIIQTHEEKESATE